MSDFEKTPEIAQWLNSGSVNFFGKPYAGKDSQARRAAKRFDGTVFGGGDVLRQLEDLMSPEALALMHSGNLIPTPEFIKLVLPLLNDPKLDGHPLMLSAVGRFDGEQEGVMEALEIAGHPLRAVIYLTLDDQLSYERFDEAHSETPTAEEDDDARGTRTDDARAKLPKRLSEFATKTMPVIDYYRHLGLVIEVDGTLPKPIVELRILEALAERALRA